MAAVPLPTCHKRPYTAFHLQGRLGELIKNNIQPAAEPRDISLAKPCRCWVGLEHMTFGCAERPATIDCIKGVAASDVTDDGIMRAQPPSPIYKCGGHLMVKGELSSFLVTLALDAMISPGESVPP